MFSRGIRIIFLSSFVLVLTIQYVAYSISPDASQYGSSYVFYVFQPNLGEEYQYRGFKYFYEYVQSFPGLKNCFDTINSVANIINGTIHNTNDISALNWLQNIFYVLNAPIIGICTFVMDIINMFIWLISMFIPTTYQW